MSQPTIARRPTLPAMSWDDCRRVVENAKAERGPAPRHSHERLRHAEERFHHLIDAVVDYAIFMLDETGNVSSWNPGARRLKGYTADEIIGRHFSTFYTADDRAAGKPQMILDAVRRDGRFEDEGWRVRKDGSRFWANVVISALRDDDDRLIGFAKVTRDLSERRKTEEELRRSEERFRLLVENVADYAIYMLDPEGRVTTWNLGAQRMKGYAASEIVGQSFARFFPPEDVAAGKPEHELGVARTNGCSEDEGWRVRKDGSRFWANAVLTALHDSQRKLVGFVKITRDLTTRREAEEKDRKLLREQTAREIAEQAERKLRESQERYRKLSERQEIVLEGVADGITVQDASGRLVFANGAAAKMFGFATGADMVDVSPEEILSRFELLDTTGGPLRTDVLPGRRVLRGEHAQSAVIHMRDRRSERDWWVLQRATAVLDANGQPELAVNIWHDVTATHRQEAHSKYLVEASAALGSSLVHEEMLQSLARLLVPGMADSCSIYLLDGDRLSEVAGAHNDTDKANALAAYRRKYPPEAGHAGGVWGVIHSGAPVILNQITDEVLARSTTDPEALAALRSIGLRAALLAPIRVGERNLGVIALVYAEAARRYDASDLALVEELARRAGVAIENAQLFAEAQDAAKAAEEASRAKDEFLATVSHELRTPLNAIVGWSTLLKERVSDRAIIKPIEVIYRNAQAQVKIIDDILDVSRVITGKFRLDPKPTDLVVVAKEAIEVVRPSAQAKKIELELATTADFCLLVADPERLQQVVWNLLSNAVKFTEMGGKIRLSVCQEGSQVILIVSDNGKGIEPAFLPVMFERFKQADSSTTRRVGGLGLGLALVRHIVELHGGRVTAASEGLGKGATFTIALPIRAVIPASVESSPRSRVASTLPPPATTPSLNGTRVLVVDDEPDARELVATVLAEAGAEVQTARSAAEGFENYKRFRPDVLVSDIGMPEEDGFSFIRRIRALPAAEGGKVPALALTAFTREDDRTKSLSAGYTTHIGKPVNPEALTSAVANLAEFGQRS